MPAWDQSQRRKDEDGRLHITWTPISKAMVCPYWGREIPDYVALGLDPDRIYQLWRHPDELAKGADTFNNIQVMSEHVAVSADDPKEDRVAGSLGTDCEFRPPYLGNSMVIYRAEDIAAIESGARRQISAGYYYRADMTPGEYPGLHYDGIMRDIRANHVALVPAGRAGPDVLVTDSGETTMKPLASRKALMVKGAITSLLRPALLPGTVLALDGALGGVNRLNWQTEKPKVLAAVLEFATPKLAKDAALDRVKADLKIALDRMDDEDDGEAEDDEITSMDEDDDETEAEKEARLAREKAAKDKKAKDAKMVKDRKAARDAKRAKDEKDDDDDEKDDDDDDKAKDGDVMDKKAMDAAIAEARSGAVADMNAAIQAREDVRPIVGQVALALDSAEKIYKWTLEQKGVDLKGVHASAYSAMVKMLPKPGQDRQTMARDAAPDTASLHSRFPGLARIGRAA